MSIASNPLNMESHGVKAWSRAYENYTLIEVDGSTELVVDMDTTSAEQGFLEDVWSKTLKVIKELVEASEES